MKRLIMGVGNPIMGDDGVGIQVARLVKERLPERDDLEIKELSVSGVKLVEEILGFDEVVIVDSHIGDKPEPGRIRQLTPEHFEDTVHVVHPHGTSFFTALELYRNLEPDRIPGRIRIYTVDIDPNPVFGESLSPPILESARKLADLICGEIEGNP